MKPKYILSLATLMAIATACKKEPDPNQSSGTNTPTYTIGNGGTYTILWTPRNETKTGPSRTEIKSALANNDTVIIVADSTYDSKKYTSRYSTGMWKVLADSLEYNKNFAFPKTIIYNGTLYVDSINGANMPELWQLPDFYDNFGMSTSARQRLMDLGFDISFFNGRNGTDAKSQQNSIAKVVQDTINTYCK